MAEAQPVFCKNGVKRATDAAERGQRELAHYVEPRGGPEERSGGRGCSQTMHRKDEEGRRPTLTSVAQLNICLSFQRIYTLYIRKSNFLRILFRLATPLGWSHKCGIKIVFPKLCSGPVCAGAGLGVRAISSICEACEAGIEGDFVPAPFFVFRA